MRSQKYNFVHIVEIYIKLLGIHGKTVICALLHDNHPINNA